MKKLFKSRLFRIAVPLALLLVLVIPSVPVGAALTDTVTVTAAPRYKLVAVTQDTWTINGITGDGLIDPSTTYYANPLGDTTAPTATVDTDEGYFNVVVTASVNVTLKVDMEDFAGGDANMTNGETGSAGATSYGAYSWYEGCTYADDKVIVKKAATGSDTLWTSSSPGDDIDVGITIVTQSTAWAGASSSTSTLKFTIA